MATFTYTNPTVGGSEDTWGATLNSNWTALGAFFGDLDSTELAVLDGITASTAELNLLTGVTVTLADITATADELNLLDGVTTATAANYRAADADKLLVADEVWASGAVVPLTDGVAISVDMATGFNFSVTLGGNRTLLNPSNPKVGQTGFIRVAQDGVGSRTLTLSSSYVTQGGSGVALTATPGAVDVLFYCVLGTTEVLISPLFGLS